MGSEGTANLCLNACRRRLFLQFFKHRRVPRAFSSVFELPEPKVPRRNRQPRDPAQQGSEELPPQMGLCQQ
jgi:hypothetical protein